MRLSCYVLSKQGVKQGDPLGMMFYGVGLLPLARKLKSDSNYTLKLKEDSTLNKDSKWTQNWYTDNSACVAELKSILEWLNLLLKRVQNVVIYQSQIKVTLWLNL